MAEQEDPTRRVRRMTAEFLARPVPDMSDPDVAAGWFDVMAAINYDTYVQLLRQGDTDRAYEALDLSIEANECATKARRGPGRRS